MKSCLLTNEFFKPALKAFYNLYFDLKAPTTIWHFQVFPWALVIVCGILLCHSHGNATQLCMYVLLKNEYSLSTKKDCLFTRNKKGNQEWFVIRVIGENWLFEFSCQISGPALLSVRVMFIGLVTFATSLPQVIPSSLRNVSII